MIVCVHWAKLPQASVARYVLVIVYRFGQVWLLITSLICVTVTVPPQLSVAITNDGSGAGTWLAQLTVTGAGQVNVGAV